MSQLFIASCITRNYYECAASFLRLLQENVKKCRLLCITNGWNADEGYKGDNIKQRFPKVEFYEMPSHWSDCHGTIQHGRWLDALPFITQDDVVLLSDADISVQRDFTDEEINHFMNYDDNTLGIGYNQGENDNCYLEAGRITMRPYAGCPYWLEHYAGTTNLIDAERVLRSWKCYNVGVMIARKSVWHRFRDNYEPDCAAYKPFSVHPSKAQFLLNVAIHRCGFNIDPLPLEMHAHGHFGPPPGITFVHVGGGVTRVDYNGKTVMFRHKM